MLTQPPERQMSLYKIVDPDDAWAGDYHGIAFDHRRRWRQHQSQLKRGAHRNPALQAAHNAAPSGLAYWLLTSGPEREIRARERLLVPRAKHHWNQQRGVGAAVA